MKRICQKFSIAICLMAGFTLTHAQEAATPEGFIRFTDRSIKFGKVVFEQQWPHKSKLFLNDSTMYYPQIGTCFQNKTGFFYILKHNGIQGKTTYLRTHESSLHLYAVSEEKAPEYYAFHQDSIPRRLDLSNVEHDFADVPVMIPYIIKARTAKNTSRLMMLSGAAIAITGALTGDGESNKIILGLGGGMLISSIFIHDRQTHYLQEAVKAYLQK